MGDLDGVTPVGPDENSNTVSNPFFHVLTDGTAVLHKAADSAAVSTDNGLQILAVRSDAGGSLVSADGDYTPLSVNASGELRVAATFTAGAEQAEDDAHTTGDTGNFVLAVRQDTLASSTSADGDYAAFKVNSDGALYIDGSNSTQPVSGTVAVSSVGGTVTVSNGGTFAVQVDGDALTALQLIDDIVHAEDAAHVSGDSGAFVLGVRNTALADLTSADGDYSPIATTAKGAVLSEILQGGAALSQSNPLPVSINQPAITGEVHDPKLETTVVSTATDNHDYTAVNTFRWTQAHLASSAGMKFVLSAGASGGPTAFRVGFIPRAGGETTVDLNPPKEVATGDIARVARTNRHPALSQDLSSTIVGIDT